MIDSARSLLAIKISIAIPIPITQPMIKSDHPLAYRIRNANVVYPALRAIMTVNCDSPYRGDTAFGKRERAPETSPGALSSY